MTRELESVLADIQNGRPPSLLLLFGDSLRVEQACETLINALVPDNHRGFNLERFDGRTTPWEQIERSLLTPPFFPGKKAVWVENVPYFISREKKGELGERVLQFWSEGKRDEASRLLLDLLALEGWTQDQWERLEAGLAMGPLVELLELDGGEGQEAVEALWAYCQSKGMNLNQRQLFATHRLPELLDARLPAWDFLLLTAVQADRRTRLYKRLDEVGAVLYLDVARDRSGRVSRESLVEFIDQRLRQAGKTAEPRARDLILLRAGADLRALHQELEKLFLYVGDHPSIRVQDVERIFADQGEGWIFDLTRAIADRDAVAALLQLARLTAQGEHPLKLLGTLASETRRLLAAHQMIDGELQGLWRRGMTFPQFQQLILTQAQPPQARNPYGDYLCLQRAENFSLAELRSFLAEMYDADLRLKSSGSDPRLVMERLILALCLGSPKGLEERRN